MVRQNLNTILKQVIKETQELKIPVSNNISEEVIINSRPKKRFGCCRKRENKFIIEISEFVLNCDEKIIRQILAHEILHTCRDCYDHGVVWKKYADMMNKAYGYNIKRTFSFEDAGIGEYKPNVSTATIRYIIKCKKCGKEYPRQRAGKITRNVKNYRCRCGGKLEVTDLTVKKQTLTV